MVRRSELVPEADSPAAPASGPFSTAPARSPDAVSDAGPAFVRCLAGRIMLDASPLAPGGSASGRSLLRFGPANRSPRPTLAAAFPEYGRHLPAAASGPGATRGCR